MAIADEQDDVDGFIGQYDEKTRKTPAIAAEIAQRLLAKGRVGDAARTLDEAERQHSGWEMPDSAWQDAHIDVLEAQGRGDDAQAARWAYFEKALSAPHLRAYLKRLPDFDDVEAEERALRHVSAHKDVMQALLFLVTWPALDKGAGLIVQQVTALDGDQYELLVPVAEALAGRYPLAATIALRAMIDFALTHSRSSRYQHSARHLMECAGLAPSIRDFAGFEAHDAYVTRLKAAHGRKTSFWNQIR